MFLSNTCFAIKVGTYEIPPYSMKEDGETIGLVTDIVNLILENAGQPPEITAYPAVRGLKMLQSGKSEVFYPIIIEDVVNYSEENITLIGPIADYNVSIFGKNDGAQVKDGGSLSSFKLGAQAGSIAEKMLKADGLKVQVTPSILASGQKLASGRIDFWITGELTGVYYSVLNDNLGNNIKLNARFKTLPVYLGVNTNINRNTMKSIQDTYKALYDEGKLQAMQKDYEQRFAVFLDYLE